jgi:hypothetical protein
MEEGNTDEQRQAVVHTLGEAFLLHTLNQQQLPERVEGQAIFDTDTEDETKTDSNSPRASRQRPRAVSSWSRCRNEPIHSINNPFDYKKQEEQERRENASRARVLRFSMLYGLSNAEIDQMNHLMTLPQRLVRSMFNLTQIHGRRAHLRLGATMIMHRRAPAEITQVDLPGLSVIYASTGSFLDACVQNIVSRALDQLSRCVSQPRTTQQLRELRSGFLKLVGTHNWGELVRFAAGTTPEAHTDSPPPRTLVQVDHAQTECCVCYTALSIPSEERKFVLDFECSHPFCRKCSDSYRKQFCHPDLIVCPFKCGFGFLRGSNTKMLAAVQATGGGAHFKNWTRGEQAAPHITAARMQQAKVKGILDGSRVQVRFAINYVDTPRSITTAFFGLCLGFTSDKHVVIRWEERTDIEDHESVGVVSVKLVSLAPLPKQSTQTGRSIRTAAEPQQIQTRRSIRTAADACATPSLGVMQSWGEYDEGDEQVVVQSANVLQSFVNWVRGQQRKSPNFEQYLRCGGAAGECNWDQLTQNLANGTRTMPPWEERMVCDYLQINVGRWRVGAHAPSVIQGWTDDHYDQRPWVEVMLSCKQGDTRGPLKRYTAVFADTVDGAPTLEQLWSSNMPDPWAQAVRERTPAGSIGPYDDYYPVMKCRKIWFYTNTKPRMQLPFSFNVSPAPSGESHQASARGAAGPAGADGSVGAGRLDDGGHVGQEPQRQQHVEEVGVQQQLGLQQQPETGVQAVGVHEEEQQQPETAVPAVGSGNLAGSDGADGSGSLGCAEGSQEEQEGGGGEAAHAHGSVVAGGGSDPLASRKRDRSHKTGSGTPATTPSQPPNVPPTTTPELTPPIPKKVRRRAEGLGGAVGPGGAADSVGAARQPQEPLHAHAPILLGVVVHQQQQEQEQGQQQQSATAVQAFVVQPETAVQAVGSGSLEGSDGADGSGSLQDSDGADDSHVGGTSAPPSPAPHASSSEPAQAADAAPNFAPGKRNRNELRALCQLCHTEWPLAGLTRTHKCQHALCPECWKTLGRRHAPEPGDPAHDHCGGPIEGCLLHDTPSTGGDGSIGIPIPGSKRSRNQTIFYAVATSSLQDPNALAAPSLPLHQIRQPLLRDFPRGMPLQQPRYQLDNMSIDTTRRQMKPASVTKLSGKCMQCSGVEGQVRNQHCDKVTPYCGNCIKKGLTCEYFDLDGPFKQRMNAMELRGTAQRSCNVCKSDHKQCDRTAGACANCIAKGLGLQCTYPLITSGGTAVYPWMATQEMGNTVESLQNWMALEANKPKWKLLPCSVLQREGYHSIPQGCSGSVPAFLVPTQLQPADSGQEVAAVAPHTPPTPSQRQAKALLDMKARNAATLQADRARSREARWLVSRVKAQEALQSLATTAANGVEHICAQIKGSQTQDAFRDWFSVLASSTVVLSDHLRAVENAGAGAFEEVSCLSPPSAVVL